MIVLLIVLLGFYTLLMVGGIHYYEAKIKDLRAAISDYQRALNITRNKPVDSHYAYLQLENKKQKDQIRALDIENDLLQKQIKKLKAQLAGDQKIQYEYTSYKPDTWESSQYEMTIEL